MTFLCWPTVRVCSLLTLIVGNYIHLPNACISIRCVKMCTVVEKERKGWTAVVKALNHNVNNSV